MIEIRDFEGNLIEISTSGMTDEQIQALKDVSSGDSNIRELNMNGLFSQEELAQMGIADRNGTRSVRPGGARDVDIEDLDLAGLSEEQIEAVEDIAAGRISPQEAVEKGVLTMPELQQIGLLGGMPADAAKRQRPAE